jgi:nucleoside-diphosphate-sugar epimerase
VGERFIISGAEQVTWRQFYAAYEDMLGVKGVILLPTEEIVRLRQSGDVASRLTFFRRDPYQVMNWPPLHHLYQRVRPFLKESSWRKAKHRLPARWVIPDAMTLSLYRSKARASIEKARRVLGYEPEFSFEQGMALTVEYLRQQGL